MQTATSETESKSLFPSICVHHYTLRAPCPKGQGTHSSLIGADGGLPQRSLGTLIGHARQQPFPAGHLLTESGPGSQRERRVPRQPCRARPLPLSASTRPTPRVERPRHPPAAWRQPSPARGARAATTGASGGGGDAAGCATRHASGSDRRATPHGCARAPPPRQNLATPARSSSLRRPPSQTAAAGRGHCCWHRCRSAGPARVTPPPRSPTGGSRVTFITRRLADEVTDKGARCGRVLLGPRPRLVAPPLGDAAVSRPSALTHNPPLLFPPFHARPRSHFTPHAVLCFGGGAVRHRRVSWPAAQLPAVAAVAVVRQPAARWQRGECPNDGAVGRELPPEWLTF